MKVKVYACSFLATPSVVEVRVYLEPCRWWLCLCTSGDCSSTCYSWDNGTSEKTSVSSQITMQNVARHSCWTTARVPQSVTVGKPGQLRPCSPMGFAMKRRALSLDSDSRTLTKTARTSWKGTNAVLVLAFGRAMRHRRSEEGGGTKTGLWAMLSLSRCKAR